MNLILSLDEETVARALSAEALGKSLNQLVREYLEQLGGKTDPVVDAAEFRHLSLETNGRPNGWVFKRDEIHER